MSPSKQLTISLSKKDSLRRQAIGKDELERVDHEVNAKGLSDSFALAIIIFTDKVFYEGSCELEKIRTELEKVKRYIEDVEKL